MQRTKVYLFLVFLIPFGLFAQDSTSSSSVKQLTRFITEKDIQMNLPYRMLDTNSNRMEIYNPAGKQVVYNDLGNIGLAVQPLIFNAERQTGFNYGFNPYDVYFLKPGKYNYINTRTPYTDITYTQGGPELLLLNLKHSQNIRPRWNAGVELNRITSLGHLLRQYSSLWGVNAFTSYYSKDKRYVLLADLTWNWGLNDESGGVRSDSSFESLTGNLKQVYTHLGNSTTYYHNRSAYVKQFYRFGQSQIIDPDQDSIYDFKPQSQFVYTFHANEMSYAFYNKGDTNSVLLPAQYYDATSSTYDSVYTGKLTNQFEYQILKDFSHWGVGNTQKDSMRMNLAVGFRHEMINVAQRVFVRQYQNTIVEASFDLLSLSDLKNTIHLGASFVTSGYNQGDYKLDISRRFKFTPITVTLSGVMQKIRPDYFFQLYKSNQFIWNNAFAPVQTNIIVLGIRTNKLRNNFQLTLKAQQLQNYVFMNASALPEQEKSSVSTAVYTIELGKTFRIWKLYFEHLAYYQKSVSSNYPGSSSNNIHLPELAGIIRYYYQAKFFGFGKFQLGFNAFYNTAYYGNAYNPATRQFYLQNDVLIGNYPVISPFFIGDLKRASLFFVYEHVNMDLIKKGMYYTAHYPIALATFRMGVRWRFYD